MTQQKVKTAPFSLVKNSLCAASIAVAAVLAGCDGGSGGGGNVSAPAKTEARIGGVVQNQHGPIRNAKIEVRDKNGQVVATSQLDGQSNRYSVTVPSGTTYPITLVATPTEGEVTDPVKAVITSSLADSMDITDISTLVVDSAIALGGLTEANIAKASGGAIGLRQRQGVSAAAGGGGAGPGQSGGGVSRGGHGGHDMSGMGGGSSPSSSGEDPNASPHQSMGH
jgi:hypothetical protein